MDQPGEFAGKTIFASTGPGGPWYLTALSRRTKSTTSQLPAMAATHVSALERCRLYAQPDKSVRIQLGDGWWIGLYEELGWLTLVDTVAAAVPVLFPGSALGAAWQVLTKEGKYVPVSYTAGGLSPLLTINGDGNTEFAPQQITPSLANIRSERSCRGGDLSGIDLSGADLSGIDFTAANFTGTNLTRSVFTKATLMNADFTKATLTSATVKGAGLDKAKFLHAVLNGVVWDAPASAVGIDLTGCSARGATFGADPKLGLDYSGAILSGADLTRADLSGLKLPGADFSGASLVDAVLDNAILDGSRFTGVTATRVSIRHASLRGCDAQAANLTHSDLSFSDLTRVRMGSRAFLFSLDPQLAAGLDSARYVPPPLVAAFQKNGATITDKDPVNTDVAGQSWTITTAATRYSLILPPGSEHLDVFLASGDLAPACLSGATCQGTIATRASMSGVDLRHVYWSQAGAKLDQADLTGAALTGAMLAGTDLSQAYLDGTDLSEAVLMGALLRGRRVGPGRDGHRFSMERALLQGADFTNTTLLGAVLVDAHVSMDNGVPLFTLPSTDAKYLTTAAITTLASSFQKAGYALGTTPTVSEGASWRIDNTMCTDPSAPLHYRISKLETNLWIFDADQGSGALFSLPLAAAAWLGHPTPARELVTAFQRNGFTLSPDAVITAVAWKVVTPSIDAGFLGPTSYPNLHIYTEPQKLRVYGTTLVRIRDWQDWGPGSLAFGQTTAIAEAMNPGSIGPSGLPASWAKTGRLSWPDFWMPNPKLRA